MPPRLSVPPERQGFSLVELLVAVSLVMVLVALLLPAAQKAMSMGDRAAMSAQMKTLANAVLLHANENDGTLPGPFLSSLNFRYKSNHGEFLMTPLVPYLDRYPAATNIKWQNTDSLMTPKQRAFRQQVLEKDGDDSAHFLIIAIEGDVVPFGWYNGGTRPMKLSALPNLSTVAMLMEADQKTKWPTTNKNSYARSTFPTRPLHGARFTSYFDGSVRQEWVR